MRRNEDPRVCKDIPKVLEAEFDVYLTPEPMLLISMLDPPGGISVLGAPGINEREGCELQASRAPERKYATGIKMFSGMLHQVDAKTESRSRGTKWELNIRVHSLFLGPGKKPISSVVESKERVMEKHFEYQQMIKILFLLRST